MNPKLGVPFKLCKTVVTGEGDTLVYPAVKSTTRIPNYLKFYPWNENTPPFIFKLYKTYDENIKSKPSIPLTDYISMGPYFNNW